MEECKEDASCEDYSDNPSVDQKKADSGDQLDNFAVGDHEMQMQETRLEESEV